jgi:AraC-like DNA-binding protein
VRDADLKLFATDLTAGGGLSRLAYARACAAGLQTEALLSSAGLTKALMDDDRARLKVQNQIRFLDLVSEALHDEWLGFHLGSSFELRELGLLYYVAASSDSLDDALRRVERYSRIANEGLSVRYLAGPETSISLGYIGIRRSSDRHQIEFCLAAIVRLCRQLAGRHLLPSRIRFAHHRAEDAAELKNFFGCDVDFGTDRDEAVFDGSLGETPIGNADPYLNKMLIGYCEAALAHRRLGRGSFRPDLENAIAPLLPHGQARAGQVARILGMSQRTLARRLASEGLTFAGVLDELKADLAKRYLRDGDLTISQIAWLLGYREVSAFTHAFKRWTGKTPRHLRSVGGKMSKPG